MIKIFRYEFRRLVCNKFFFGLLVITLFYGWQVLMGDVIRGVSHTAPFSPWGFGFYLSQVLPLICLGESFFLSFFVSRAERRVSQLTAATPVDPRRYQLVRAAAVLAGTLLLAACAVALCLGFYAVLFHVLPLGALLPPALLLLVPSLPFCLGAGFFASRFHPAALFAVAAAVLLLTLLPLPGFASLSLSGFFRSYPLAAAVLDPPFAVPAPLLLSRGAYLFLAFVLLKKAGTPR